MLTIEEHLEALDEHLDAMEERLGALEEDAIEHKKFREKFNSIISLKVAKTENGRVSLRDHGDK